jgi:hypothetical protein
LEDDEPFQPDPASHGLDRIEAPGKIHPGGDGSTGLRLGHQPEGHGGLAARGCSGQRNRCIAGHATRPEDGIEGGEARPDHPIRVGRPRFRLEFGDDRERSDDPRSCRTPARPEGRESGRDVRGEARHGSSIIEQMFCIVNAEPLEYRAH